MLPLCLTACRRQRNLAESMGYDLSKSVVPSAIPTHDFDAESSAIQGPVSRAMYTPEPPRLRSDRELVPHDMTLQEVVFLALSNADVIRQRGQFLSPNNSLLRSPEGVTTAYDTAIQSSGVLFGQRGYEAALSEFDTQFTTRMIWGNSTTVQNTNSAGVRAGSVLSDDTAQFQAVMQRALLSGGQFGLSHTWNYSSNTMLSGTRMFPSVYEGFLRAEFRQPLLAGAGQRYTSIAGPISENIQGVTGVQQGMLIAKINNLITQCDYEINVVNFIHDVETQYWQLSAAYKVYEIESESLERAERILEMVEARADAPGGDLSRVVEARDGVLQADQRILDALEGIYTNETQLRLLMNYPGEDERTIRPIDVPVLSDVQLEWGRALSDALNRRPELRRQKQVLKNAQLQLEAAENLNRPRLDFVASGQFNGLGDYLLGPSHTDGTDRSLGSAYGRLLATRETGWNLGGEVSFPLGFRFTKQQVQNNELRVIEAMRILEAQEAEVLAELTSAFQKVDKAYLAMEKQAEIVDNAEDRLSAAHAQYESNRDGRGYLDLDSLNRAREISSQAHVQLAQAQIEYSLALTEIEQRCGRLLDHFGVTLEFGDDRARSYVSPLPPEVQSPLPVSPELGPHPIEDPQPTPADEPSRTDVIREPGQEVSLFVEPDEALFSENSNASTAEDAVEIQSAASEDEP